MTKVAVVLALLLGSSEARAVCPPIAGADPAALASHDDTERLAWIQARLARTSHRATVWLRGWEIGLVGATAVNLALIPVLGNTPSNRIDFGLGAATTIVGVVPLLFWQPRVIDDDRDLTDAVGKPGMDRCAVLDDAEHRMVASAASQRQQRAWYMHAGNVALNAGVTLLFGAFHHWSSGILSGVGGVLVGEIIIYTEPNDQIDDLARYRRGELVAPAQHTWWLQPLAEPHATGLTLAISFE